MKALGEDVAPGDFMWNGVPLRGLCGHCQTYVDSTDPNHRVTSIVQGGRGVECVLRGDIAAEDGGPLDLAAVCPASGAGHNYREHDNSPAGPSRAWYCEDCGRAAPDIDDDGFPIRRPPRVPTP